MNAPSSEKTSRLSAIPTKWLWRAGLSLVVLLILATAPFWLPPANAWFQAMSKNLSGSNGESAPAEDHGEEDHAHHDHAHHDHDHAGHDESESIELSPQARKNIGLRVEEVQLTTHNRPMTIPAIITERPARTHQKIAAPLTGVVTGIHIIGSEMVTSGDLLFTLRLTHEDLVNEQTEFLTNLGQLDVERRELKRLQDISSAAIPQKTLLERQYAIDKLEALLKAERNSLQLHGLTEEQINQIAEGRSLIREIKVRVPFLHPDDSVHSESEAKDHQGNAPSPGTPSEADEHEVRSGRFVISQLQVHTGEAVQTGQTLCVLSDYSEVYIEGRAFEQDAELITQTMLENRRVTALPENVDPGSPKALKDLEIVHVANEVDRDSRALHFYVRLSNEIARETKQGEHSFVTWRYKPGQRMQIRVPVEAWKDIFVLPVDALAQDGLETFVFVENGGHFDRQPVHVLYRDQYQAVIDNDGSIFPGDRVAMNGAHQLQMALKNKAGGAVDPHAGHNH